MLELTDLSVHYGNVAAVAGVSVRVEEGEIVAIIGPNGAGKTSTLRALSGLVRPSGGRIVFRGVDISRWREEVLTRKHLSCEQLLTEFADHIDKEHGSLAPKDDLTMIVAEVM